MQYSFWSEAIFWTASEALALWSQQQKVAKTTSKSLSLSNSSQKLPFFAVLMYALYGHPRYFNSTARVSRLSFRFLWLCLHWWAWIDQKQLCSGEHFWTFSEDPSERESVFIKSEFEHRCFSGMSLEFSEELFCRTPMNSRGVFRTRSEITMKLF